MPHHTTLLSWFKTLFLKIFHSKCFVAWMLCLHWCDTNVTHRGWCVSAGIGRERADQLPAGLPGARRLPQQRPVWTAATPARSVAKKTMIVFGDALLDWAGKAAELPFFWNTEAGFQLEDYLDNQYLLLQLTIAIFILELEVILATASPAPLESIFVSQNPLQREELSCEYDWQLLHPPPTSLCCNSLIHW